MKLRTAAQIEAVLARITYSPSCVDMGWQWEVSPITAVVGVMKDERLGDRPMLDIVGFHIRTSFARPDRTTGKIERGMGAWHHVPLDTDETRLFFRAFVAMKAILEHELMEAVLFDGVRLLDPHHTIDDLKAAARHAEPSFIDGRVV